MTAKRIWVAAVAAAAMLVAALGGLSVSARDSLPATWSTTGTRSRRTRSSRPRRPERGSRRRPPCSASRWCRAPSTTRSTRSTEATEPYLVAPPADPADSKEAAAATAAFRVLVGLFPTQQATLAAALRRVRSRACPTGPAKAGGIAVGEASGRGDAHGAGERRPRRPVHVRLSAPTPATGGRRRRTSGSTPRRGSANVRPFLVPNVEMLRTDGPNALTSARLRGGLQRGQGARLAHEHDPHGGSDRGRDLLAGPAGSRSGTASFARWPRARSSTSSTAPACSR